MKPDPRIFRFLELTLTTGGDRKKKELKIIFDLKIIQTDLGVCKSLVHLLLKEDPGRKQDHLHFLAPPSK